MPWDREAARAAGKKSGEARRRMAHAKAMGQIDPILEGLGFEKPYPAHLIPLAEALAGGSQKGIQAGKMLMDEAKKLRKASCDDPLDGSYHIRNPDAECPMCGCSQNAHQGVSIVMSKEAVDYMTEQQVLWRLRDLGYELVPPKNEEEDEDEEADGGLKEETTWESVLLKFGGPSKPRAEPSRWFARNPKPKQDSPRWVRRVGQ